MLSIYPPSFRGCYINIFNSNFKSFLYFFEKGYNTYCAFS